MQIGPATDTPTCATEKELFFETKPFEELTIECLVHAEPTEVLFFWEFNSTLASDVTDNTNLRNEPLMAIANSGLRSELKFTARSAQDYGTLYCFAQNRIGQQKQPCVFHITKSGKSVSARALSLFRCILTGKTLTEVPDSPQNCSLTNVTIASLAVQCSLNSVNRHSEQYHLEIYNEANNLVKNVSSAEGPTFQLTDLPPGFSFSLFVYASNKNGHSDKVRIKANTLVGEPRKLGKC